MTSDDTALAPVVEALREVVVWLRFSGQDQLRQTLQSLLSTENDRTIYELTDGTRIQTEVAQEASVTSAAVSLKWKEWRRRGLLLETADRKKPRHLASIQFLGGLPEDG